MTRKPLSANWPVHCAGIVCFALGWFLVTFDYAGASHDFGITLVPTLKPVGFILLGTSAALATRTLSARNFAFKWVGANVLALLGKVGWEAISYRDGTYVTSENWSYFAAIGVSLLVVGVPVILINWCCERFRRNG